MMIGHSPAWPTSALPIESRGCFDALNRYPPGLAVGRLIKGVFGTRCVRRNCLARRGRQKARLVNPLLVWQRSCAHASRMSVSLSRVVAAGSPAVRLQVLGVAAQVFANRRNHQFAIDHRQQRDDAPRITSGSRRAISECRPPAAPLARCGAEPGHGEHRRDQRQDAAGAVEERQRAIAVVFAP